MEPAFEDDFRADNQEWKAIPHCESARGRERCDDACTRLLSELTRQRAAISRLPPVVVLLRMLRRGIAPHRLSPAAVVSPSAIYRRACAVMLAKRAIHGVHRAEILDVGEIPVHSYFHWPCCAASRTFFVDSSAIPSGPDVESLPPVGRREPHSPRPILGVSVAVGRCLL